MCMRVRVFRGRVTPMETGIYIHAYIHTCIHVYVRTCVQGQGDPGRDSMHAYIHAYMCTWVRAFKGTVILTEIGMYMYMYIYMCMYSHF